ncbi:hypothetical protein EMIT043CA1_40054 [Pseudomonas brassicacearum]
MAVRRNYQRALGLSTAEGILIFHSFLNVDEAKSYPYAYVTARAFNKKLVRAQLRDSAAGYL